jgi:transcriptional regulator with XRE-family HTH domain
LIQGQQSRDFFLSSGHNTAVRGTVIYSAFGPRVRELRQAERISLGELARRASISKGALSAYERGEQIPGLAACERIAAALGSTLPVLLDKIEGRSAE